MANTSDPWALEREKWRSFPRVRPPHIDVPGPGQRSVWDFPRPPRIEPVDRRVCVIYAGLTVADTTAALRVCETASPPAYYIRPADALLSHVAPSTRTSFCEWKGVAAYWSLRVGDRLGKDCAWSYPSPDPGYEAIEDWLAFFPQRMDACWVGDDLVRPQPGRYYGGWITPDLVGPFKGAPGTEAW
jgi:uncharacterized protein (DUF427 family)